jgi:lantibiotic biosynthesis protein
VGNFPSVTNGIGVPWTPILTGSLWSEAIATVNALSSALGEQEVVPANKASLASGSAGLAVFYTFLSDTQPDLDENCSKRALKFLTHSVETLASQSQPPHFYGGFTGVAWALEYLQGRLLERDDDDPNSPIDEALAVLLSQSPWRGDYDLIAGLVGYGVYALAREHSPERRMLLATIVRHLEETATATATGLTWFTPAYLLTERQREHDPNGFYNLGLAHGVPGVIALLAQICAEGIESEKARQLLDGAVNWLLSQENPPGSETRFPATLSADGPSADRKSSRVSWCYGDLGVSTALLWAARTVHESSWEREAIRIATRAAERPFRESGVVDAGLCHGAAGNGHLFNRLYQATRDEVFLDAARRYFEQALGFRRPGHGVGGFLAWNGLDGGRWRSEPGLLEGAAGIGLALLTAVSSVEPDWDRMLLVSVPPR